MIVVFPYSPVDQQLAAKLSGWILELGKNEGHRCLIVRDIRCNPNYDSEIKSNLSKVFDSVETITVVERIDGWPKAPNLIFRTAAKHIQYTDPVPWLWCEADIVPIKPGWVQELATEYDQEPRKPFLGDFVNVPDVIPHLSGIAIYPGKITEYAGEAVMADEIAWDCAAASQTVPQMKQTVKICHRWKHPPFNNQSEVDNLLGQLKDTCVLFHADKSGTLIDFLRERRDGRKVEQTQSSVNVGAGIGTVDIFIKTYPKDYPWLNWCLMSIGRFCSGHRRTVIVSPEIVPGQTSIVSPEKGNDHYLSQQVFKLYADTFTDSDWILFTDSDTIFTCPVTPETYLKQGKFVWMMTPMAEAHPDEQQAWRRVMRKFFGREPEYEFMRRHPFLLPRWLLADLRAFCVRQHGVELKDYVMAQSYREFTEFNVLGMYAYEYHRDKFEWLDTSKVPEKDWPILTVDQQWSHNPIPVEKWEKILSSGVDSETLRESGDRHAPGRPDQHRGCPPVTKRSGDDVSGGSTPPAQTNLSVGHGEEKQPVPILRGSPLGESPKPDRQTQFPKLTEMLRKEKLRANAAKARTAKAAKRLFNRGVNETLKSWPQTAIISRAEPCPQIPWDNKMDSICEINKLAQRLYKFCDAPMHTKRVRDELRKVGVIR